MKTVRAMSAAGRKRFGATVRALRLSKGWTQEELGHKAGLHPTYIGGIERGERNVGFDNLLKVARAFGVAPADLFSGFRK
jgi:transcriptional regulator with XRE-family HTH domain